MSDFYPLEAIESWIEEFYFIGRDWDDVIYNEFFNAEPHTFSKEDFLKLKSYVNSLRAKVDAATPFHK